MNDGAALLASILAQPAEDTPRLMYADWLEENDRPVRADFIRADNARVRDNIPLPARLWVGPAGVKQSVICPWCDETWYVEVTCTVDRGFVGSITCDATTWLRHADRIVATQPITDVQYHRR